MLLKYLESLPRIRLLPKHTPTHILPNLSRFTGTPIWIKRDDQTARPYGGNKPRKLEYLLGEALHQEAHTVLSVGGIGSNHCLATALYARKVGLKSIFILFPQPENSFVHNNLKHLKQIADTVVFSQDYTELPELTNEIITANPGTYFIPAGGSSPLGALGFVRAALELSTQIHSGEVPCPTHIYLAAGTCGTLAGLILGCRLADLPNRVTGVRVVDEIVTNSDCVMQLIDGMQSILAAGDPACGKVKIHPADFELRHDQFGDGYGFPTPEGDAALNLLLDLENVEMDPTYTAKCMAGLLSDIKTRALTGPILYWHTYSGTRMHELHP
jgi:1-aminocyclopropane-1-carboxylate deaminase/D-cysteine desulfhydrase-like pyridoxal-dependent ACC family enzyme